MVFYKDSFVWKIILTLAAVKFLFLAYVCLANPLGTALFTFPDTAGYLHPAQTLWKCGTLLEAGTNLPMTLRTPAYPLFLFLFYVLPGSAVWAVGAQIILSSLLPAAAYQITLLFAPRRTARCAAGLCALSVLYFVYSFALLSDVLCAFLLAWTVYFALKFIRCGQTVTLLQATVLLCLAAAARPTAYAFVFVCAALLAAYVWSGKTRLRTALIGFALPSVLLLGGWQLRNYVQTGFGGFTTFSAFQTYIWNADAYAAEHHLTNEEADRLLRTQRPDGFDGWPLAAQNKWLAAQGRKLTWRSLPYKLPRLPFWAAKTLLGNNFIFSQQLLWGRPAPGAQTDSRLMNAALPARGYLHRAEDAVLFALTLLQIVLLALLAGVGLVVSYRLLPRTAWLFLTGYAGYFWAIGSAFFGAQSRYRAPFEFILCVFGAFALDKWFARFEKRPAK